MCLGVFSMPFLHQEGRRDSGVSVAIGGSVISLTLLPGCIASEAAGRGEASPPGRTKRSK